MGIYVLFTQLDCELIHSCNKRSLNHEFGIVTCVISFNPPSFSMKVFIQTLLYITGTVLRLGYHWSSKNSNSTALKGYISKLDE